MLWAAHRADPKACGNRRRIRVHRALEKFYHTELISLGPSNCPKTLQTTTYSVYFYSPKYNNNKNREQKPFHCEGLKKKKKGGGKKNAVPTAIKVRLFASPVSTETWRYSNV